MKFDTFKIGEYAFKTARINQISKAPRLRNERTNLNGDLLIDQPVGGKRTITVTIALCSEDDIAVIDKAIDDIFNDITFNDGQTAVTVYATLSQIDKAQPFRYEGADGVKMYYNNIKMTWRER